jgi:hypothetical protein
VEELLTVIARSAGSFLLDRVLSYDEKIYEVGLKPPAQSMVGAEAWKKPFRCNVTYSTPEFQCYILPTIFIYKYLCISSFSFFFWKLEHTIENRNSMLKTLFWNEYLSTLLNLDKTDIKRRIYLKAVAHMIAKLSSTAMV